MTEAEEIWDRLKYGPFEGNVIINFLGDNIANCFNSCWISDARHVKVFVSEIEQQNHRDYEIDVNTVIFVRAPGYDERIVIEAYGQKD